MFKLVEPYQKRPIRFLELWEKDGWHLKVYSFAYQIPLARTHVVEASKSILWNHLQEVSRDKSHYNVGFIGVNDGHGAVFAFVDFWADENELHHHIFVSPKDEVEKLEYKTPTGLTACVWDAAADKFLQSSPAADSESISRTHRTKTRSSRHDRQRYEQY